MSHRILAVGEWGPGLALLAPLLDAGCQVTVAIRARAAVAAASEPAPCLLLVALPPRTSDALTPAVLGLGQVPWLAWNRHDHPAAALAAYDAGAMAVLPGALPPSVLLRAIERGTLRGHDLETGAPLPKTRHCRPGESIALEAAEVLEVHDGVVALVTVGHDQAEVLLGLCGPGRTLVGGQDSAGSLRLRAWTDATVSVLPWAAALADPSLPQRLVGRLRETEAWAAARARPYLEDRLLGILALLAEQFGVPDGDGTLLDVRLTHADLAAAVGATRTTVTRLLGDLRHRGRIRPVRLGRETRLCLVGWASDGDRSASSAVSSDRPPAPRPHDHWGRPLPAVGTRSPRRGLPR